DILDLAGLGATAVAALTAQALPAADAAALAEPLLAQTGGNPLMVTRLLADLRRDGGPVDAGTVRAARPPEIADMVGARLDELGPDASRLATAVAVLGTDAALLRRVAALAGLAIDAAAEEVTRLVAADLLVAGDPLRFAHPLVASAALDRLASPERAVEHLRAARLLDEDGARAAVVAARLLEAVPSGEHWAVRALRTAGEEALAQGDPAGASRLLRRALVEGPDEDERAAIAFPLARAAAFAGDEDADARMQAALDAAPNATVQVVALLDRGDALVAAGTPERAREVLDRALALAAAPDVPEQLRAYAVLATETAAWVLGDPRHRATPTGVGEEAAAHALAEAAALALTGAGAAEDIAALATRALDGLTGLARLGGGFLATMALCASDHDEPLARLMDDGLVWAQDVGSPLATGTWEAGLGILAGWRGDLEAAALHCERAIALEAEGWDRHAPAVRAVVIIAALDRGDVDTARVAAEPRDAWTGRIDFPAFLIQRARTLAPEAAIATLRAAGTAAEAMGMRCPALVPWREALALALDQRAPDEAAALAAEHLQLAEHLGTPRAKGTALRTIGLLTRDAEPLEAAVAQLATSPARLEHARAELALGETLRRAGHRVDARAHLHEAVTLAERCGATALVVRARDELRAAGGRNRPRTADGELTPAERRVADLAAAGASNPEIAEQLFLGRRTVEMHLSRSYRKLGISGRGELAARLDVT
ncbi:MAG: hypothetical protein JHC74_14105, partial [Thermoleophilia bacterium]|nr:hypothetical protein [Thermoleophilia bacterium]